MSGETRKSRFLQQTVSDLGKEETHTNQRKIRGGNVLLSISLLVGADGGVGWGGAASQDLYTWQLAHFRLVLFPAIPRCSWRHAAKRRQAVKGF